MSVMVILEVTAKPECVDNLIGMFRENFKQTRQYEGFLNIYMTRCQDDENTLVLVQQCEARAHYENYLAWRAGTGMVDKLASLAAKTPSIRYFNQLDL